MSTKRTSWRWEWTFSIHIDKPLAYLAYLTRFWVIELPSLWVWERNTTKGIYNGFHWFQKVTKGSKRFILAPQSLDNNLWISLNDKRRDAKFLCKKKCPNYCQSFNIFWRGRERDFLRMRSKNNFSTILNHSNKTCFIRIPQKPLHQNWL